MQRFWKALPRRQAVNPATQAGVIVDDARKLGDFTATAVGYDCSLKKEEVARSHILTRSGSSMTFLDMGGGEGKLEYLLGIRENLEFDDDFYRGNRARFDEQYLFFCLDVAGEPSDTRLVADICADDFPVTHARFRSFFDVVYSNNVFEHLRRPWIAARNIAHLLKPGGVAVIIAPFAVRYHEVPADYFRYTHTGLASLFEDCGGMRILISGYDITGRRNNWQGQGRHNDICPVDQFGAWRENWFVVTVAEKLAAATS
jgi:SAM-dependent methyltransferase